MLSVLFIISVFAVVVFFLGYLFGIEESEDYTAVWLALAAISSILK